MLKLHRHRAVKALARECAYLGPADTQHQKPAAHGGISRTDKCRCGAYRRSNHNGPHREYGNWHNHKFR